MKRASSSSRVKDAQSPSREAAQECSPGRKPWVQMESDAALKGRNHSCGTDSFRGSAIFVRAVTTWPKQAAGKVDVSTAGAEALVGGKSLLQGQGPPKTAPPKTRVFSEPVKSVPSRARRAASRLRPTLSFVILPLLFLLSCSTNSGEKEAAVPVQLVTVEKKTIERTVAAEAVLFPLQQAAITPKISAPV
jgi:hypothetical protein